MKLKNVGYKQVARCGWSDGTYRIPADATAEVPEAVGLRLLSVFPGEFVVVEDAATEPVKPVPPDGAPAVAVEQPRRRGRRARG